MLQTIPSSQVIIPGVIGCPIPITIKVWSTPPTDSSGTGGIAQDISGWTFLFTVKNLYTDPDSKAIFKKDWSIGVGLGASGVTSQEIPAAITLGMVSKSYFMDVKTIAPPSTEPEFLLGGSIAMGNTATMRLAPS